MGGVRSFDRLGGVGSEEVCDSQPGWVVARFRGPVCRRSTQSMTKNPADSADKTDLVSADSNFRGLIHRIGDRLRADRLATSVTPRHCLGVLGIRCRGKGKWRFGKHRRTSRHLLLLVFLHRATTCPGRTKRSRTKLFVAIRRAHGIRTEGETASRPRLAISLLVRVGTAR